MAEEKNKRGIVYVLTNAAMPELVKIGHHNGTTTQSLQTRVDALYSGKDKTGVPLPFDIVHAFQVNNPAGKEQRLHEYLKKQRINPKREFFKVDQDEILRATALWDDAVRLDIGKRPTNPHISKGEFEANTREQKKLKAKRAKRADFDFRAVGIRVGSRLTFSENPEETATVIDPQGRKNIRFRGKPHTLSGATKILLEEEGVRQCTSVNGTLFWEYKEPGKKAKILNSIREEKEEKAGK